MTVLGDMSGSETRNKWRGIATGKQNCPLLLLHLASLLSAALSFVKNVENGTGEIA